MDKLIQDIIKMARYKGVGFEICYEESSNTFYGKTEGFVGKSKTLGGALEDLLKFIKTKYE